MYMYSVCQFGSMGPWVPSPGSGRVDTEYIITRLCFYTSLENLPFFTKRFNHTAVVFFSGNNTIKHINRHFIGTQTVFYCIEHLQ